MPEPGLYALPDIAWLTQLANDLFRAQPDSSPPAIATPAGPTPTHPVGGAGLAAPSMPLPVTGVPAPAASLPAEGGIRALLGEPPGWLVPPNAVGGFGPATPSAPLPPTSVNEVPLPAMPMAATPGAGAPSARNVGSGEG